MPGTAHPGPEGILPPKASGLRTSKGIKSSWAGSLERAIRAMAGHGALTWDAGVA